MTDWLLRFMARAFYVVIAFMSVILGLLGITVFIGTTHDLVNGIPTHWAIQYLAAVLLISAGSYLWEKF